MTTEPRTCVICHTGRQRHGETTRTLERGDVTIVVRHVPAEVCDNCREAYLEEDVVRELLQIFEQAIAAGVKTEVRDYVAHAA